MLDKLNRKFADLRISVTDRCNFRCDYCMPREVFNSSYQFLPQKELLSYEEIYRMVCIFYRLGARKVRLSGGEPLLRRNIETLVKLITTIDPSIDCCLTTNGSRLTEAKAQQLKSAGLSRITISLDTLDETVFTRISNVKTSLQTVLSGIENAQKAGISPIKINMVVKKGVNDKEVLPMADRFRNSGCILRFIEFMDVGNHNQWQHSQVVKSAEILKNISKFYALIPAKENLRGEVARRWKYVDGGGEIGFISSVSSPFCRDCNRVRMSADGKIFTCLFASKGYDVRCLLRSDTDDRTVCEHLEAIWRERSDRYSELRFERVIPGKVEMSYIGG